jgi:hypothetical protein
VTHDPEAGEVDRDTVILVLRRNGVGVSDDADNPGSVILIKGTTVESKPLPNPVGRRLVQYLKRTYDIPIHFFYHPEMMDNARLDKPSKE